MMIEKKFTRLELINAIEKAHGREVKGLEIYYPSDYRCKYRLWIELWFKDQERWQGRVHYAKNEDSVTDLFDGKVEPVSWHWDCHDDIVLKGVFRVKEGFEF